jgi:hypothetical protein
MWIIETNQELRALCKYFYIIADIKKKRLKLRMDHGSVVTEIFEGKMGKRKRMGRPRLR